MDRKKMVFEIYALSKEFGISVQQLDRKCLVLHPKNAEQIKKAFEISEKYTKIDYDANGFVEHIYFIVHVK